ncbi:MoaD/ThiS family protein [Candidatus Woesearchaeota archaeon]|nr:MoaD/ThiS family protein [Candidatus Woesearchaeota archaeon]
MPAVHLERENKTVKVKGLRVKEILKELKINPTTVIITRNNELITDDAELSNKEKIKILPVISGG